MHQVAYASVSAVSATSSDSPNSHTTQLVSGVDADGEHWRVTCSDCGYEAKWWSELNARFDAAEHSRDGTRLAEPGTLGTVADAEIHHESTSEEPPPGSDEAGGLTRLIGSARTIGKQAGGATASASMKAAAVARSAGAGTARSVGAGAVKTAHAVGSGTAKAGVAGAQAVSKSAKWLFDLTSERTTSVFSAAQGLLASDLSASLNGLVQSAVEGAPTIYDKAMDAVYIETFIGGANHRLFDGGHTIGGAFRAARDASGSTQSCRY